MPSIVKTGSIWNSPHRVRGQVVRRVCEALLATYGQPRLGNPKDPIDDLIFIIISNKTSSDMAMRTYTTLKQEFVAWDTILDSPLSTLRSILQPAGLATVKSQQMRSALNKIKSDFGKCDLRELKRNSEKEIQEYLVSLPGVSEKVAKCVMMYALGLSVLPVDSHVHRISKRLGWTSRKRADQCHSELEALILPKWRYSFHVGCILHGRSICRSKNPSCDRCCVNSSCEYFQNGKKFD